MENISYRRDMDHNYLIINHETLKDDYQLGMLTKNRITGLLTCSVGMVDAGISLYYEITSRQTLSLLLERKRLSGREMASLLEGILTAVKSCNEYLLDIRYLLLAPEFIYLDPDEWSVSLCLDPLCESTEGSRHPLQNLAEYLLEHLDRQDSDAVTLGYEFYRIAGEENPSLSKLIEDWKNGSLYRYTGQDGPSGESPEKVAESRPLSSLHEGSDMSGFKDYTADDSIKGGTTCLSDSSVPGLFLHSQNPAYPDFKITGNSFVIGKKKDSVDGFIKSRGISRLHGKITKEDEFYYITDLNSTNGTYLNGGRLDVHEKARLRSGDCLSFAEIKYVVELFA